MYKVKSQDTRQKMKARRETVVKSIVEDRNTNAAQRNLKSNIVTLRHELYHLTVALVRR